MTEHPIAGGPPPFLRITGAYPAGQGRIETVSLELNTSFGPGSDLEISSFCTEAIRALCGTAPAAGASAVDWRRLQAPKPIHLVPDAAVGTSVTCERDGGV